MRKLVCTLSQELFGEPVYRACLTALLMASHERLGKHSVLSALDGELLRDIALRANQDRRVSGKFPPCSCLMTWNSYAVAMSNARLRIPLTPHE